MNNYPNDRGYNTSPNPMGGQGPRMPPRPSGPISNNASGAAGGATGGPGSYQPKTSYGAAPDSHGSYTHQNSYGQPAPRQQQSHQNQPAFQPQPSKRMRAVKTSHERYALTNYVVANAQDFSSHTRYILVEHQFVFSINFEDGFPVGCLGFSNLQRKWINTPLNKEIDVQPFDPSLDGHDVYLSTLEVE
ncbi:transport between ER and Golgi ATPase protein, partial [Lobosporangium transversale]